MTYHGFTLLIQGLVVWEFRGEFLGIGSSNHNRRLVEGVKRLKKRQEEQIKNDKIGEIRYKPLTLVK